MHLHLGRREGEAIASRLEIGAATLLVAYAIVCFVVASSDGSVPDAVVDLGVGALVAAGVGWLAPRLTGLVLVLTGAVIGPATVLIARGVGHNYAASLDIRALAALFATPFIAGILLLVADRVKAH